jgi:hypothetical protein
METMGWRFKERFEVSVRGGRFEGSVRGWRLEGSGEKLD